MANGVKVIGWLAIIFGILVFIFPNIINYLIAIFLVVTGINLLVWAGRITKI